MRDDVVQLARDPRPLGRRGEASLLVSLELEACRTLLERLEQLPAVPDVLSEDASRRDQSCQPDEAPDVRSVEPPGQGEEHAELENPRRDE